ncbi:MAG: response regulator [Anaerolineae bacterium]|nr:response regulator [Anaerolineae bacterium]
MSEQPVILIVDDEISARATLEAALFLENYTLIFANNGQEALAHLEADPPDAILLDVMMPEMNGFEVCQRIKTHEKWRHIPTIIVTALDSRDDFVRGLDAGADDFLCKPVNSVELRARVRSMLRIKQQYDELETLLHLREDLVNMLVHDMRHPLTLILIANSMLQKVLTEPKELKYVEDALRETRRLESFINDLLIVVKTQAGHLVLNRSTLDANQLVREVCETHSLMTEVKKVKLIVELPEVSREVSLDKNMMQRVLDNLLSNAFKFSPPESSITLRLEYSATAQSPEPCIRISVLDRGPGIPQEYQDHIFDLFEIVQLKQTGIPQLGLGLTFCKLVVEAHGGQIFVTDNQPQGSIFIVEI